MDELVKLFNSICISKDSDELSELVSQFKKLSVIDSVIKEQLITMYNALKSLERKPRCVLYDLNINMNNNYIY